METDRQDEPSAQEDNNQSDSLNIVDSDGVKCKSFVAVYLDDLVKISKDGPTHLVHLNTLFRALWTV